MFPPESHNGSDNNCVTMYSYALPSVSVARQLYDNDCYVTVTLTLADARGNPVHSATSEPLGEPEGLYEGFTDYGASIHTESAGAPQTWPPSGTVTAQITVDGAPCVPPSMQSFSFQ